jgi:hypothetical protein
MNPKVSVMRAWNLLEDVPPVIFQGVTVRLKTRWLMDRTTGILKKHFFRSMTIRAFIDSFRKDQTQLLVEGNKTSIKSPVV